ncbi:protein of unknown function (plasmid) [Pseudorhizobium banfieldiae]|uniref:Uncharacterized protein n=1 Tax=Pseudorhizobium banfieldiae TaxID=1125847 RepID=L0NN34_9HYPH|nr:protein of unknown function [Pseudorhizobium banfieldiae]
MHLFRNKIFQMKYFIRRYVNQYFRFGARCGIASPGAAARVDAPLRARRGTGHGTGSHAGDGPVTAAGGVESHGAAPP